MSVDVLGEQYNNEIEVQALYGPKGETGETGATGAAGQDGRGIVSILKTATYGLDDTYTITYTDGTTQNIIIRNGADASPATEFLAGIVKLADRYKGSYGFNDNESVPTMATVLECETRYMNNCILRLPTTMINFTWFVNFSDDEDFILFADSSYTKPNGTSIPLKVTIQDDLTLDYTFTSGGKYLVFPLGDKLTAYPIENCFCRSSAPSVMASKCIYYNMSDRKLYQTSDGGTTWTESNCGFPIAVVDYDDSENTLSVHQRFDSVFFMENTIVYPKDTVISMPAYENELTGIKDGPMVIFNDQKIFTLENTNNEHEVLSVSPEYECSEYDEYLEGGYVENSFGFDSNKKYLCHNTIDNVNMAVETDSEGGIDSVENVPDTYMADVIFTDNLITYIDYLKPVNFTDKKIASWNELGLCKGVWKEEKYEIPVAVDESGMLWQVGLDSEPVEDSEKGITSGAVHNAIASLETQIPTVPTNVSAFTNDSNYVTSTVLSQNLPVSNALETGAVSTNSAVYADILSRYHSSFDLSKFTVVGSPTITNDGIASGFSQYNFATIPVFALSQNSEMVMKIRHKLPNTISSSNMDWLFRAGLYTNSNSLNIAIHPTALKASVMLGNNVSATNHNVLTLGKEYDFFIIFTGGKARIDYKEVGTNILVNGDSVDIPSGYSLNGNPRVGSYDGTFYCYGTIDLKYLSIKAGGVTVFSGNKTGSDSYTVDGNTVTIPYTVTSGGAKIADVTSRTDIQSIYNLNGFAPYYTIDETSQNFTLPMGDLYGMLQKLSDRITALET